MEKYSLDNVCTGDHKADEVNSRIMEHASDIAEKLTEKDCEISKIKCYVTEMEGETEVESYTEEAQDIFNEYYDEYVDILYNFTNRVIEIDKSE